MSHSHSHLRRTISRRPCSPGGERWERACRAWFGEVARWRQQLIGRSATRQAQLAWERVSAGSSQGHEGPCDPDPGAGDDEAREEQPSRRTVTPTAIRPAGAGPAKWTADEDEA